MTTHQILQDITNALENTLLSARNGIAPIGPHDYASRLALVDAAKLHLRGRPEKTSTQMEGNDFTLCALSMGKLFKVTHVCPDDATANEVCADNKAVAVIGTDKTGRVYLAESRHCGTGKLSAP